MKQIQYMQQCSAHQLALMSSGHDQSMQRLNDTLKAQHEETKRELGDLKLRHEKLASVLTERVEAIESRLAKYDAMEQGLEDRFKSMQVSLKQQLLEELKASKDDVLRPPALASGERPRFVASRIFLRGWCEYGMETQHGITKDHAKSLVNRIWGYLNRDTSSYFVAPPRHFYTARFRSSQIVLALKDTAKAGDAEWLAEQLNDVLRSKHVSHNDRQVYAVAEKELWKRLRNAAIIKAEKVILNECTVPDCMHLEKAWPDGALLAVLEGRTYTLGEWKSDAWLWNSDIRVLWPTVQTEDLTLALEALGRR
jgi:chaperonin cofactor prefoldin